METNIIRRFNQYLDRELQVLPNTAEARDFRAELLDNMTARSFDLRSEGMAEDEVYSACIESLGDISGTLKELSKNPIDILRDKRLWTNMLLVMAYCLVMVIAYIGVAAFTGLWGTLALIIFPSLFVPLGVAGSVVILRRNTTLKRHATTGLVIWELMIMLVTASYFALAFGVKSGWATAGRCWSLFTTIPALFFVAKVITNLCFRKTRHVGITIVVGLLITISVAVYLVLASVIWAFHPYWLIILIGVALSIIAVVIALKRNSNQ
jgi:hypothetical protein